MISVIREDEITRNKIKPFELWYKEHYMVQKTEVGTPYFIENGNHAFDDELSKDGECTHSSIESDINKYEQMINSKVSLMTESMSNNVQENISKFERLNDDKLSVIAKFMMDKTQECLTKFEELDDIKGFLLLEHYDTTMSV